MFCNKTLPKGLTKKNPLKDFVVTSIYRLTFYDKIFRILQYKILSL